MSIFLLVIIISAVGHLSPILSLYFILLALPFYLLPFFSISFPLLPPFLSPFPPIPLFLFCFSFSPSLPYFPHFYPISFYLPSSSTPPPPIFPPAPFLAFLLHTLFPLSPFPAIVLSLSLPLTFFPFPLLPFPFPSRLPVAVPWAPACRLSGAAGDRSLRTTVFLWSPSEDVRTAWLTHMLSFLVFRHQLFVDNGRQFICCYVIWRL